MELSDTTADCGTPINDNGWNHVDNTPINVATGPSEATPAVPGSETALMQSEVTGISQQNLNNNMPSATVTSSQQQCESASTVTTAASDSASQQMIQTSVIHTETASMPIPSDLNTCSASASVIITSDDSSSTINNNLSLQNQAYNQSGTQTAASSPVESALERFNNRMNQEFDRNSHLAATVQSQDSLTSNVQYQGQQLQDQVQQHRQQTQQSLNSLRSSPTGPTGSSTSSAVENLMARTTSAGVSGLSQTLNTGPSFHITGSSSGGGGGGGGSSSESDTNNCNSQQNYTNSYSQNLNQQASNSMISANASGLNQTTQSSGLGNETIPVQANHQPQQGQITGQIQQPIQSQPNNSLSQNGLNAATINISTEVCEPAAPPQPPVERHACQGCGKFANSALCCPVCVQYNRKTFFCTQECFAKNWAGHQKLHVLLKQQKQLAESVGLGSSSVLSGHGYNIGTESQVKARGPVPMRNNSMNGSLSNTQSQIDSEDISKVRRGQNGGMPSPNLSQGTTFGSSLGNSFSGALMSGFTELTKNSDSYVNTAFTLAQQAKGVISDKIKESEVLKIGGGTATHSGQGGIGLSEMTSIVTSPPGQQYQTNTNSNQNMNYTQNNQNQNYSSNLNLNANGQQLQQSSSKTTTVPTSAVKEPGTNPFGFSRRHLGTNNSNNSYNSSGQKSNSNAEQDPLKAASAGLASIFTYTSDMNTIQKDENTGKPIVQDNHSNSNQLTNQNSSNSLLFTGLSILGGLSTNLNNLVNSSSSSSSTGVLGSIISKSFGVSPTRNGNILPGGPTSGGPGTLKLSSDSTTTNILNGSSSSSSSSSLYCCKCALSCMCGCLGFINRRCSFKTKCILFAIFMFIFISIWAKIARILGVFEFFIGGALSTISNGGSKLMQQQSTQQMPKSGVNTQFEATEESDSDTEQDPNAPYLSEKITVATGGFETQSSISSRKSRQGTRNSFQVQSSNESELDSESSNGGQNAESSDSKSEKSEKAWQSNVKQDKNKFTDDPVDSDPEQESDSQKDSESDSQVKQESKNAISQKDFEQYRLEMERKVAALERKLSDTNLNAQISNTNTVTNNNIVNSAAAVTSSYESDKGKSSIAAVKKEKQTDSTNDFKDSLYDTEKSESQSGQSETVTTTKSTIHRESSTTQSTSIPEESESDSAVKIQKTKEPGSSTDFMSPNYDADPGPDSTSQ